MLEPQSLRFPRMGGHQVEMLKWYCRLQLQRWILAMFLGSLPSEAVHFMVGSYPARAIEFCFSMADVVNLD